MLLLDEDVKRISGLGYEEKFFAKVTDGFKVLKNSKMEMCVFHDGTKCTIYENRPKGCKLYPIIFDEESMTATKDHFCPHREEFDLSLKAEQELSDVYPRLMGERLDRVKKAKARDSKPATAL